VNPKISFLHICLITLLLTGCTTSPKDAVVNREDSMDQIKLIVTSKYDVNKKVETKSLNDIVQEKYLKSKETDNLSDFIDYYLIRQFAINILEKKINDATQSSLLGSKSKNLNCLFDVENCDKNNEYDKVGGWVNELLSLDSGNRVGMAYLESTRPVNPLLQKLSKIAPSSRLVNAFNLSIFTSMAKDATSSKRRVSDSFSLVRSSSRMSQEQLLRMLGTNPNTSPSCRPPVAALPNDQGALPTGAVGQSQFSLPICLNDIFSDSNVGFSLHNSAGSALTNSPLLRNPDKLMQKTVIDLLGFIAEAEGLNFLIGFDKIVVFKGARVPQDLEQEIFVYSVNAKNVQVMAIYNAISSAGYTRLIAGVDVGNGILWLAANMHDYMNAMQIVSAIDQAPAQVRVKLEILQIEQGLISEIGARIPQNIGFAIGDPTFRSYGVQTGSQLSNSVFGTGIDTTSSETRNILNTYGYNTVNGATGYVNLDNWQRGKAAEMVRMIVRDEAFRLAAQKQNFTIELSAKPTLNITSGKIATFSSGSRMPVVTTGVAGGGIITESITMLDVGLNIDMEAEVLDGENIAIGVNIRVSNVLKETKSTRGSSQPHLSTRSLNTSLIIQDGETVLLGGMSSLDNSRSDDGLPGLADSPATSWLGGSNSKKQTKNDFVILMTPEIITPQLDVLHAMRNSRFGDERNPALSATFGRTLESYINSSASTSFNANAAAAAQAVPNSGRRGR